MPSHRDPASATLRLPNSSSMADQARGTSHPSQEGGEVGGGVSSSSFDSPYLSHLQTHLGRMTLTAPDNMRKSKKAKQTKSKVKPKKPLTDRNRLDENGSHLRPPLTQHNTASSSSLNLSSVSAGAAVSTSAGPVSRRSNNRTVAASSSLQTSHHQHPHLDSGSSRQVSRTTRPSRDQSSRPSSSLSHNSTTSAPLAAALPRSATAQQSSLQRYNRRNDDVITMSTVDEPDPDDLPPPFPQDATRPPTPPLPPPSGHPSEWTEQQRIAQQQAERYRVPDSPPPAFRSDPESDAEIQSDRHLARRPSLESVSDSSQDESIEISQERLAWEADLAAGLSFQDRLVREQERRKARETGLVMDQHLSLQQQEQEGPTYQHENEPEQQQPLQPSSSSSRLNPSVVEISSVPSSSAALPSSAAVKQIIPAEVQVEAPATTAATETATTSATATATATTATTTATASRISKPQTPLEQPTLTESTRSNQLGLELSPPDQGHGTSFSSQAAAVVRRTTSDSGAPRPASQPSPSTVVSGPKTTRPKAKLKPSNASNLTNTNTSTRPVSSQPQPSKRKQKTRTDAQRNALPPRRPEDILFNISAPPAAFNQSDGELGHASTSSRRLAAAVASVSSDEDGQGQAAIDSDSSVDQWMAEAAAFDALRRKQEGIPADLDQATMDSNSTSDNEADGDVGRPDRSSHRVVQAYLPKAPPPLALGRSRGGAAYSSSSSSPSSSDTDEQLGRYSSSQTMPSASRSSFTPSTHASLASLPSADGDRLASGQPDVPPPPRRNQLDPQNLSSNATSNHAIRSPCRVDSNSATGNASTQPSVQDVQRADGLSKSFSSAEKGKQPIRGTSSTASQQQPLYVPISLKMAQEQPSASLIPSAGEFQEDRSSSRDVSTDEIQPTVASPGAISQRPTLASTKSSDTLFKFKQLPLRPDIASNTTASNTTASNTYPEQQPSCQQGTIPTNPSSPFSAQLPLGLRLKGLFGTPLVETPSPSCHLSSELVADGTPPLTSFSSSSSPAAAASIAPATAAFGSQSSSATAAVPSLSRRSSNKSLENKPSASSINDIASASNRISVAAESSSNAVIPPKPPIPTSLRPSFLPQGSSSGSRRVLDDSVAVARSSVKADESAVRDGSHAEGMPLTANGDDQPARIPGAFQLSRQGAILRTKTGVGPPPPPPRKPTSFVNPCSSAAPIPRGRLPAITDATRHFPPSKQPVPTPSWLAHIPSEERSRLPPPLIPDKLSHAAVEAQSVINETWKPASTLPSTPLSHSPTKMSASRVSAMISMFEQASPVLSPTFRSASFQPVPDCATLSNDRCHNLNVSSTSALESNSSLNASTSNRLDSNDNSNDQGRLEFGPPKRRPPPPPPRSMKPPSIFRSPQVPAPPSASAATDPSMSFSSSRIPTTTAAAATTESMMDCRKPSQPPVVPPKLLIPKILSDTNSNGNPSQLSDALSSRAMPPTIWTPSIPTSRVPRPLPPLPNPFRPQPAAASLAGNTNLEPSVGGFANRTMMASSSSSTPFSNLANITSSSSASVEQPSTEVDHDGRTSTTAAAVAPRNVSAAISIDSNHSSSMNEDHHDNQGETRSSTAATATTATTAATTTTPTNPTTEFTELDVLLSRLEQSEQPASSHYDTFLLLSELIGPADPSNSGTIRKDPFENITVGIVECIHRRITSTGPFRTTQKAAIFPCQHVFHQRCAQKWLTTLVATAASSSANDDDGHYRCPVCRASISNVL